MLALLLGGVGGAKLALGLARTFLPEELTLIVNTADDLEWHGLYVAPDVDTVLYTLAGLADQRTGWGIADDTTAVLDALAEYGFEPWFRIGDRDLATHVARTEWMRSGMRYTEVVARLAAAMRVRVRVLPMSDQPLRTLVHTAEETLEFQDYFVRRRALVPVTGISFAGVESARPSPEVVAALREAEAIILAPSNPFVSIGPILALRGLRDALRAGQAPVVAISPIVGGRALKGPADQMLRDLGHEPSARAVAALYADFLDGFVLDVVDQGMHSDIEALGMRALVTNTVMKTMEEREELARETVAFAHGLRGRR